MAELGVTFRETEAYVTNSAGDAWIDYDFSGTGSYPTVLSNGLSCGWMPSSGGISARDRSTGVDVRLSGLHYNISGTEQVFFKVDLPSGAGAYDIRAAFGEPTYGVSDDYYQFRDNVTAFATVDDSDGHSSSQWYDASGVLRTSSSDWASNNVRINRTFSSSILQLAMGRGAGAAGNSVVAYLSVESAGGGGPTGNPWYYYAQQ